MNYKSLPKIKILKVFHRGKLKDKATEIEILILTIAEICQVCFTFQNIFMEDSPLPLGWTDVQGHKSPCTVLYIIIVAQRIKFEVEQELINILFLRRLGLYLLCECACVSVYVTLWGHECVYTSRGLDFIMGTKLNVTL